MSKIIFHEGFFIFSNLISNSKLIYGKIIERFLETQTNDILRLYIIIFRFVHNDRVQMTFLYYINSLFLFFFYFENFTLIKVIRFYAIVVIVYRWRHVRTETSRQWSLKPPTRTKDDFRLWHMHFAKSVKVMKMPICNPLINSRFQSPLLQSAAAQITWFNG